MRAHSDQYPHWNGIDGLLGIRFLSTIGGSRVTHGCSLSNESGALANTAAALNGAIGLDARVRNRSRLTPSTKCHVLLSADKKQRRKRVPTL
jgi:hypothetical protein